MAYSKRTWKGRQGTGLNKFSINGESPVTVVNQPDSITEQGDALSAGNLNDLEQRIADGFDSAHGELTDLISDITDGTLVVKKAQCDQYGNVIDTTYATKADVNAIDANLEARIENLEQKAGDYSVTQYRGTNAVPTGKAKNALVESIVGKSRGWNQLTPISVLPATDSYIQNNNDGSFTVIQSPTSEYLVNISIHNDVIQGHAYLLSPNHNMFDLDKIGSYGIDGKVFKALASGTVATQRIYVPANTPVGTRIWIFFRDVTIMFPEYTADQLVAKDLSGLAEICPDILKYDAYGYSLVDTEVEGVESYPTNILEPMTQTTPNGTYSDGTYTNNTRAGASAWAGKVDVSRFGIVTIACDSLGGEFAFGLSNDDVSGSANILAKCPTAVGGTSKTVITSGYKYLYMYFRTYTEGTTATLTKVRVNVGDTALAYTTYVAPSTLSLSSPVTLRSAGSVADTDELNVEVEQIVDGETVKVSKRRSTEKVEHVDTGTLAWNYESATQRFYSILTDARKATIGYTVPLGATFALPLARMFDSVEREYTQMISDIANKDDIYWFYTNASGQTSFQIKDTTYNSVGSASDPSTFLGHLQGMILNYELATPTETLSDPVINNTIATEGGGTINTIQTQTPVIDNCMDVGYLAV